MAKRLINTFTNLDLNLDENKIKLGELKDGELVVQSSKSGELRLWGKTLNGEIISAPTKEDVAEIVYEKLGDIDVDIDLTDYAKKDEVYKKSEVYNKLEVDNLISDVTISDEQLSEYAKKDELNSHKDEFNTYKSELSKILESKVDNSELDKYYIKSEVDELIEEVRIPEEQLNSYVKKDELELYKTEVSETLENKVDNSELDNYYTKPEVDGLFSTMGAYGMVVIPEDVYRVLETKGIAKYNDETLVYSDTVMYFLFDPNEEVVKPTFDPDFNEPEVTLMKDFMPELPIELKNGQSCTVMLNGKTLTGPLFAESHGEAVSGGTSDSYVFWVKDGGELIINGDGKVESQEAKYSMAVWAQGGKVTINGGEYYNHGDGCDLIYASAGGHVDIYSGEFHATEYRGVEAGTQNPHSALNIKNGDREKSDIVVYGGKFFGFDPANNLSEPNPSQEWLEKHPNGFVAKGYKSIEVTPDVWEVIPAFTEPEIILYNDCSLDEPVILSNGQKCNIELNGKALTAPVFTESNGEVIEGNSDSYVFWVKDGGELVIDGDGRVEAQEAQYSMAVWAQGGKVTINGGEFYNHGDGCDLIYASNGGQVEIHGGEFHATEYRGVEAGTQNPHSALNIKNGDRENSDIVVYGGKFFGFDPANNVSEGPDTNFVAEGYKSVEVETGVWEVMPE